MGISLLCLLLIFVFINPRQILNSVREADFGLLGLTALGILGFMLLRAVRWRFMLRYQVGYLPVFHVQNIGYMLNMYLPARLGDVARAILIGSTPPITVSQGISTMVVERILDMMFMVTLLPFTLATVPTLPEEIRRAALAAGVVALLAIIILIVAANKRPFFNRLATKILNRIPRLDTAAWVRRVDELLIGLDSLTRFKDGMILVLLSILVWLPILFAYQVGMMAVGLSVTLPMTAFVVCAAALSIAAPSSPGGVGVFQAGVIGALTTILGQPGAESASFAFAYHATNYLVLTILGFIGFMATGSTLRHVMDTTQGYLRRQKSAGVEEV